MISENFFNIMTSSNMLKIILYFGNNSSDIHIHNLDIDYEISQGLNLWTKPLTLTSESVG